MSYNVTWKIVVVFSVTQIVRIVPSIALSHCPEKGRDGTTFYDTMRGKHLFSNSTYAVCEKSCKHCLFPPNSDAGKFTALFFAPGPQGLAIALNTFAYCSPRTRES